MPDDRVIIFLPEADGLVKACSGFLLGLPMLFGLALASLRHDGVLVRGGLALFSASAVAVLLLGIYCFYLFLCQF